MKIIRTRQLNDRQLGEIKALEDACRSHDHTTLTFPTEDGCLSYLLYDKGMLLSVFSAFFNENETCSCSAFTHPSARRQGYFNLLLEELLKEAEDCDLIFLADDSCPDTRCTLEAMDAELVSREHMMALRLPDQPACTEFQGIKLQPPVHFSTEDILYTVFLNMQPVGSFHLIFQNNAVYFYGFEIKETLRNQGIGTRAANALLYELINLKTGKPERILLQVSGSNAPAMALYGRMGFEVTETLSYYIY